MAKEASLLVEKKQRGRDTGRSLIDYPVKELQLKQRLIRLPIQKVIFSSFILLTWLA